MSRINEFEVVQNAALGSVALWIFSVEYYKNRNGTVGPKLQLALPILPMLMNQETLKAISSRHFTGGLYKAVAENRIFSVGLQKRMSDMTNQTFRALNIAFALKVLNFDQRRNQLIPMRKSLPFQLFNVENKAILAGAKRLGFWFSTTSIEQICLLLRIRL